MLCLHYNAVDGVWTAFRACLRKCLSAVRQVLTGRSSYVSQRGATEGSIPAAGEACKALLRTSCSSLKREFTSDSFGFSAEVTVFSAPTAVPCPRGPHPEHPHTAYKAEASRLRHISPHNGPAGMRLTTAGGQEVVPGQTSLSIISV